jgi:hypothetical protein
MKDLTNKIFNKWTVLKEVERNKSNKRMWFCKCVCGNTSTIIQENLTLNKSTQCRSCALTSKNKKQDFLREDHRLYSVWKNMKSRVNNPNRSHYHRYGGRGIKICERWNDFLLFLEDMEDSFEEGLTLDRIDNDGDYSPENCRWATQKEQNNNQEKSLHLLFEGHYYTESELSEKTGVKRTTIQQRRRRGYSVNEMVYGKKDSQAPKQVEYEGLVYNSLKDLAKAYHINPETFRYRIRNGWGLDNSIKGIKP